MKAYRLPEFKKWYESRDNRTKDRLQIDKRILAAEGGAFGKDTRDLDDGLGEFKWKSGRRVYFAIGTIHEDDLKKELEGKSPTSAQKEEQRLILIFGGNKNGQDRDIAEARKIIRKYLETI